MPLVTLKKDKEVVHVDAGSSSETFWRDQGYTENGKKPRVRRTQEQIKADEAKAEKVKKPAPEKTKKVPEPKSAEPDKKSEVVKPAEVVDVTKDSASEFSK